MALTADDIEKYLHGDRIPVQTKDGPKGYITYRRAGDVPGLDLGGKPFAEVYTNEESDLITLNPCTLEEMCGRAMAYAITAQRRAEEQNQANVRHRG